MKTSLDPRHQKRERVIRELFAFSFEKKQNKKENLKEILKSLPKVDVIISQAAPEWPIEQINRIDLSILRLAVWELLIKQKEPPKVIIDEAIELAKSYGSEKSPSFINGVLGTVFKEYQKKDQNDKKNSKAKS